MGMYTEIHFNSKLKKDTPENIINILRAMVDINGGAIGSSGNPASDHDLFESGRWRYMLQCDSYYFDADTISHIRFDDISKSYYLCIRSNFKNYDDEITKFLDWIAPYLDKLPGEFLGFYRYEESEVPTLLFMGDNKVKTIVPEIPKT